MLTGFTNLILHISYHTLDEGSVHINASKYTRQNTEQDQQCTYKRNIEAHSQNHCFSGKAISITYCECVSVALVMQHKKAHALYVLSSAAYPAPPYYSTLPHKRNDFQKNAIEHGMCVVIFSTNLSEAFLILSRIQPDVTINVHTSSCKVAVILVIF
jgi:hypothetical protein